MLWMNGCNAMLWEKSRKSTKVAHGRTRVNTSVHFTFKFKTINNAITLQYLSNLTNSYSCGHDNINNTLLKSISNEISACITLIINQSTSTCCYPENLKLAKVIPIFEKNGKLEINNYRPILVLPVI